MKTLSDLILAAGGISALVILVVSYGGKLLFNKITSSFQHEYNEKIVKLTNELSRNNHLLDAAQSIFLNNVKTVNEYKIKILEDLWRSTFALRDSVPIYTYSTLMALGDSNEQWSISNLKKIQPLGEENRYNRILNERNNNNGFEQWNVFSQNLSNKRPFISEDLYQLLWLYGLMLFRIPYEFARQVWVYSFSEINSTNINKDDTIPHWREDEHAVNSIKQILSKEEAEEILKPKFGSFKEATDFIQMKILSRIREELTGNHESAEHLRILLQVESLKTSIDINTKNK